MHYPLARIAPAGLVAFAALAAIQSRPFAGTAAPLGIRPGMTVRQLTMTLGSQDGAFRLHRPNMPNPSNLDPATADFPYSARVYLWDDGTTLFEIHVVEGVVVDVHFGPSQRGPRPWWDVLISQVQP